jgi:hypothetical protein
MIQGTLKLDKMLVGVGKTCIDDGKPWIGCNTGFNPVRVRIWLWKSVFVTGFQTDRQRWMVGRSGDVLNDPKKRMDCLI